MHRPARGWWAVHLPWLGGLCFAMACGDAPPLPWEIEDPAVPDTGPRRPPDCDVADGFELLPIDDFERGAATNAFTNNEVCDRCTRQEGDARAACENACRESQSPTDFDKPLPAELIPDGRCGSRYALHLTSEFFYEWGGLVGFPFAPDTDVSDYEGVAFWGRIRWNTRSTVRVAALEPETDATYRDPETDLPRCDPQSTLDDFDEACDPHGAFVIMTGDWQWFAVPFAEMRQRGFGHVAPGLDLTQVRRVDIEYGQGAWDLWVDDLAFYRRRDGED